MVCARLQVSLDAVVESLRQQCKGYVETARYYTGAGAPASLASRACRDGVPMDPSDAAVATLVATHNASVGVYGHAEAAAAAHDAAAVRAARLRAHTNFPVTDYAYLLGARCYLLPIVAHHNGAQPSVATQCS
jgi:hypothetical protein